MLNPITLIYNEKMEESLNELGQLAILGAKSIPAKRARIVAVRDCLRELKPDSQCLEIGSAHGGFSYLFSDQGKWTFNDIDKENLLIAQTILKGQFTSEDAVTYLKGKKNTLDFIVCIGSIIYFSEPIELLKAIHSALKPEGKLVISGREARTYDPLIIARKVLGIEKAIGAKVNFNSQQMRKALADSGYKVIKEVRYLGFFTALLQTVIDFVNLGVGKGENQLTHQLSQLDRRQIKKKILFCHLSQVLSSITLQVDRVFFFLPRENFVLVAVKQVGS